MNENSPTNGSEEPESVTNSDSSTKSLGAVSDAKKPRHPALRLLFKALRIYLILALAMFVFQRKIMYYPDSSEAALPTSKAYEGLVEMSVTTSDGVKLKGWHWPGERGVTCVLFHGNAGNREIRAGWMRGFRELGLGVLQVDYRGYGGSEGSPSEEGFHYSDAVIYRTCNSIAVHSCHERAR
ncbi:MAG: hypothetical protein AAF517_20395 [Planctomycetota bacterium]